MPCGGHLRESGLPPTFIVFCTKVRTHFWFWLFFSWPWRSKLQKYVYTYVSFSAKKKQLSAVHVARRNCKTVYSICPWISLEYNVAAFCSTLTAFFFFLVFSSLTCILTAMMTEVRSAPRDLWRTKRLRVRVHNLEEREREENGIEIG